MTSSAASSAAPSSAARTASAGTTPTSAPSPERAVAVARGRLSELDPRRLPGWAQALLLLLASRVLVTYVAYRAARMAPRRRDGTFWGYWDIANNWDGTWYQRVAVQGYPAHLPHDSTGAVAPNTWAFYPLYPGVVGRLSDATGLAWTPAATVVSLACAAGAVVLIRSLLARLAGPRQALWAVALLCFFPSAPVLQLPYAESLSLVLLAATLWSLQRERYLLAVPVLLLLGLSRPVAVPMVVVLTVHLAGRLWRTRRLRGNLGAVAAWLASGLAAVEWPVIAWRVTGVRDAYTLTMASWRTPRELVPFRPWWGASQFYLGHLIGPAVLVAVLATLTWWLARPAARVIGTDLRVWCGAYAVYLLAVLDSFTSLPRYLLPLFPLGALLVSSSRSRAYRIALTVAMAALVVVWMLAVWRSHIWAP
jgi:hypothetical protein